MKKHKIPTIDVRKYGGKQVALVRGRVVASGRTTTQVLERARKLVSPSRHGEIWVFAVPKSLTVVYFIS